MPVKTDLKQDEDPPPYDHRNIPIWALINLTKLLKELPNLRVVKLTESSLWGEPAYVVVVRSGSLDLKYTAIIQKGMHF
jgi:hypothetical protein